MEGLREVLPLAGMILLAVLAYFVLRWRIHWYFRYRTRLHEQQAAQLHESLRNSPTYRIPVENKNTQE